jgi:hypothetical protein
MRLGGTHGSWQITVNDGEPFLLAALWMRDAGGMIVPPDDTVPGPLTEVSAVPLGSLDLGVEWLAWWHSIIDSAGQAPDPSIEPAYDTPDPLGLARLPSLAAVVSARWPEYLLWRRDHVRRRTASDPTTGGVARAVQVELGRPLRPFKLEFSLLPVRDERIRRLQPDHYLVPEQVYGSDRWPGWLRSLILELG